MKGRRQKAEGTKAEEKQKGRTEMTIEELQAWWQGTIDMAFLLRQKEIMEKENPNINQLTSEEYINIYKGMQKYINEIIKGLHVKEIESLKKLAMLKYHVKMMEDFSNELSEAKSSYKAKKLVKKWLKYFETVLGVSAQKS